MSLPRTSHLAAPPSQPRCLACGSAESILWAVARDREYRTSDETFSFRRCQRCDCLFLDPLPRDRLPEIYPANYYSFRLRPPSAVDRVKDWLDRRLFRRLLAGLPGEHLSALDVGGGAGQQLTQLRRLDPRVIFTQVVDLDARAAARARAAGHSYFQGRIEDFVPERAFDLVLLLNLIEHVEDPGAVLSRIRDLLQPSGIALIKTPNTDSWDARLFRRRNWGGYHCPRHWTLFTLPGFRRLAEAAGLEVAQARYTQGAPFWATSVLFLLEDRGWASISRQCPAIDHPLYGPLCAVFAAFDFMRSPFARTSQMFCLLKPKQVRPGAPDGRAD